MCQVVSLVGSEGVLAPALSEYTSFGHLCFKQPLGYCSDFVRLKMPSSKNFSTIFFFFPLVHRQKLLFACVLWLTFMYFFWKLGDPFPILSPKHGEFPIFVYSSLLKVIFALLPLSWSFLLCYVYSTFGTIESISCNSVCFETWNLKIASQPTRNGWMYPSYLL